MSKPGLPISRERAFGDVAHGRNFRFEHSGCAKIGPKIFDKHMTDWHSGAIPSEGKMGRLPGLRFTATKLPPMNH
jgi:hypothetical protein